MLRNFNEFYLNYLTLHQNRWNQRLHASGLLLAWCGAAISLKESSTIYIIAGIALGYGLAWTGHFAFEKNKPATWTDPFKSLIADHIMTKEILVREFKNWKRIKN